ncbi:Histidine kinase [Cyclobacterium xiamenense]|uniref:Histidine kinase n=1 Tax=Cyclobacterium xiamenense TaxID=1297121 RepID=A0A1H6UBL7_9BACT|nr:histidine kinase [Cyclobacterium xiamenense]SEI89748.1 Histidine kinase [Cyclobacterium xiamenense]
MKNKPLAFSEIEWWAVTFVFLILVLFNLLSTGNMQYQVAPGGYFARFFIPLILFFVFYLMHRVLIPRYLRTKKERPFIGYSLLTLCLSYALVTLFSMGAGITQTPFTPYFFTAMALYGGYLVWVLLLKEVFLPPKMNDYLTYNLLRLSSIFFFVVLFLFNFDFLVSRDISVILALFLPASILVVLYNFFLIYRMRLQGKHRAALWFNILLMLIFPGFMLFAGLMGREAVLVFLGLGTGLVIQLVVLPLSDLAFEKYFGMKGKIATLSHQVDRGSADLRFLKSQINPHFLFNALNTLYGAALMENAEKTSDGIQKLGDMMRFMLHENQLDKIPLRREIEYLRNYLDLQMLRFKKEDNLEISIKLNEEHCEGTIAPMLLIPFVENAFKHGISTKNKSWIKINLRCLAGSVHLDVVNSLHPPKVLKDPSDESGIGLDNVRKRLQVLYPDRHDLAIVANDTEHFVHFSVQID